jgi:signal transduction histidine kinase
VRQVELVTDSWITDLYQDQEGMVWVGTASSGLSLLRYNQYDTLISDDEWGHRPVKSVFHTSEGVLFIGTEGSGVYRQDEDGWRRYWMGSGMTNNYVWSFAETRNEGTPRILVGTWGGGLNVLDGDRVGAFPGWPETYHSIAALCVGQDGSIWAGTNRGLVRFKDCRIETYGGDAGIASPQVRSLVEGPDGKIWFGTLGGTLGCIDTDGVLVQYGAEEGLPDDNIGYLHFDQEGILWLGTNSSGLLAFQGGQFIRVDRRNGLITNNIASIFQTGSGDYWISSNRGIFAVSGASMQEVIAGKRNRVDLSVIQDGLDRIDTVLGSQHVMTEAPDGTLIFAARDRVVGIEPDFGMGDPVALNALIEEFRVDGEMLWDSSKERGLNSGKIPRVQPGAKRFEFRFSIPSLSDSSRFNLLYRLDGVDSDWIGIGEDRTIVYQQLRPGAYRLRVAARYESQDSLYPESSLSFVVIPYWWEIRWVQVVLASAGMVLLLILLLWRMNEIALRKTELMRREQALERERMRIARDLHDDLGSSLTHIALLCAGTNETAETAESHTHRLQAINLRATDSIQQMDEIVWAVNPKHDSLESLANYLTQFVQSMTRAAGISCRLEIPVELPAWVLSAEVRHNMFLGAKEAIRNAVQHSGASRIALRINVSETHMEILVEDNGCGLKAIIKDRGLGLTSMQQRASEAGGTLAFLDHEGGGLCVQFRYPLSEIISPRQN